MTIEGWIYWGLAFVILLGLRLTPPLERPWAYDPGPAPGEHYPFWDRWSWWHLVMPGLIVLVPSVLGWSDLLISVILGYAVVEGWEYVEGYRSTSDVTLGVLSIVAATGITLIWMSL